MSTGKRLKINDEVARIREQIQRAKGEIVPGSIVDAALDRIAASITRIQRETANV